MSLYGPMRRMQKNKPRVNPPAPEPEMKTPKQETTAEPVKQSPKSNSGYYRYVMELHKSVSSKFKEEEINTDNT